MKKILLLFVVITGCVAQKKGDFELKELVSGGYEFEKEGNTNRIDYLYAEGDFSYRPEEYKLLKHKAEEKKAALTNKKYTLHSLYIYKKTDIINQHYGKGKEGLDGHNRDLIAYVRYSGDKMDICYIIEEGNVIYDVLTDQREDFEFEK
ncbi:hypothetical protein ACR79M_00400 [Sphingobacterium spiritivorum]|uniref:hypothetical protein n=1 Tax=Sphingobacterium spiritivorum TaxID=258 RepID=UPI003DA5BAA8